MSNVWEKIKKILGIGYCKDCGEKLVVRYVYDKWAQRDVVDYVCPHCDNLGRFNVD